MKQWAYLLAVYAATMSAAFGVTGYITNPVVPAAQSDELEETVIENGVLVINATDYHDMRIGDGLTPGGVRIYRTDALTEPPRSYPHGFTMNGNAISLNGSYDVGAEGPLFYVRAGGSNVLSVIAMAEGVGATLSETYSSSNTLVVLLSVEDGASDPLVQYTTNLIAPAWTDCVYYVSRTGTNLIQIEMPVPDEDERGYYKITALSGYRARFGIPLEAPMVTATQFVLNGSAITEWPTGSSTDAVTAAGASNIAQNVLDASLADTNLTSAASKQYVLDNAGGGGVTNTYPVYSVGNLGANATFNFGYGSYQIATQNVTITNTAYSVPNVSNAWEMTVDVFWSAGTSWTWDTNAFKFIGGSVPSLTSNAWNTLYMQHRPNQTNVLVGLAE